MLDGEITVTLEGFNQFLGAMQRATHPTQGITYNVMRLYAQKVLRHLYDRTPIWVPQEPTDYLSHGYPGMLRDGWVGGTDMSPEAYARTKLPIERMLDGYSVKIENKCYYAAFVEYGHRQHPDQYVPPIQRYLVKNFAPPHPFVRPAIEELYTTIQVDASHILAAYVSSIFNKW